MDAEKPIPVVKIPPFNFVGGPTNQGRAVNIQGAWYPEILVAVIITAVVSV